MKAFVRASVTLVLAAPLVLGLSRVEERFDRPARTLLEDLRETGTFRLAVIPGTRTYFLHRGIPVGFEYDLLSDFAREIGLPLRIIPVGTPGEAAALLLSGKVEVAALPPREGPIEGALEAVLSPRRAVGARAGSDRSLFVRGDCRELASELHAYLADARTDGSLALLSRRYFARNSALRHRVARGSGLRISEFDSTIAKHARAEGLDWRFVAAVISEESRFDATAVSPRGATGLMQLMPTLAEAVEVDDLTNPEANIRAGVRYLRRLMDLYPDASSEDRPSIVLAAYLMGPGHLLDARQLAAELGYDPSVWKGGLDQVVPLLEDPRYFERTRFGYAQGQEVVRYVERVLERYDVYREHVFASEDGKKTAPEDATPRWPGARIRM